MASLGTMPLVNDYSLCQQTVTVYHMEGGAVTRTVYTKAYLERKKTESVGATGSSEENGFLLVVPGGAQACRVGDKVFDGEGPLVPGTEPAPTTTTTTTTTGAVATTTTTTTTATTTTTTTTTGGEPAQSVDSWWRSLIPTKVDGLLVVRHVAVRRWNGAIVHTEAGG